MIEQVIGERGGGAAGGAAGDVAPGIVTAGVNLPGLVGAGGTTGVQTRQLVWLVAGEIEVLLLATTATQGSLPQLSQVGVDIAVGFVNPILAS